MESVEQMVGIAEIGIKCMERDVVNRVSAELHSSVKFESSSSQRPTDVCKGQRVGRRAHQPAGYMHAVRSSRKWHIHTSGSGEHRDHWFSRRPGDMQISTGNLAGQGS